jgi:hypothetical protein
MTAPYQTETLSHSSTSPTTVADGATKALGESLGRWSNRLLTCRCRDPIWVGLGWVGWGWGWVGHECVSIDWSMLLGPTIE